MASPLDTTVPQTRIRLVAREAWSSVEVRWSVALLSLVVVSEIAFLVDGLVRGTLASLMVLAVLLTVGPLRRSRRAAIALSVISLLRTLSIALPSLLIPTWVWYAEIGALVIVATLLAARLIGLNSRALGIRPAPPVDTLLAGGAGFLLGLLGLALIGPLPLGMDRSNATLVLASLAVIIGAAVAEELVFRGLIQNVAESIFPRSGVAVSAGLSTLLYLATLNPRYIILMAALAVVFGSLTRRYGSVVPAIACHATLIWSQLILWPALLP